MPFAFLALGVLLGGGAARARPEETKKILDLAAKSGVDRVILVAAAMALPAGLLKAAVAAMAEA